MARLKEHWFTNRAYRATCRKSEDPQDGISIANMGGIFSIIFLGIGIALVTIIYEYFYFVHGDKFRYLYSRVRGRGKVEGEKESFFSVFSRRISVKFNRSSTVHKVKPTLPRKR